MLTYFPSDHLFIVSVTSSLPRRAISKEVVQLERLINGLLGSLGCKKQRPIQVSSHYGSLSKGRVWKQGCHEPQKQMHTWPWGNAGAHPTLNSTTDMDAGPLCLCFCRSCPHKPSLGTLLYLIACILMVIMYSWTLPCHDIVSFLLSVCCPISAPSTNQSILWP